VTFDTSEFLENINYFKHKNFKIKKTIAIQGVGVVESFEDLIGLIFKKIHKSQLISLME